MKELFKTVYFWASSQPIFIQVALGIAIVIVGLYMLAWILGIGFLTLLRISDKKKKNEDGR